MGGAPSRLLAEAALAGLSGRRTDPQRDPAHRAPYATDPWAYFRDIYGVELSQQQDEVLAAVLEHDRVGIQSANNVGKTFLMGGIVGWVMDAVAAQPGDDGLDERGARVLLPGPSLTAVRSTIWGEVRGAIRRARTRGYAMPGRQFSGVSNLTLWSVREHWEVEVMSPPRKPAEKQAHSAAGRHHAEQWAIIEEGAGVTLALWASVLGMCSGYGNKIVTAWNPTERIGYVYDSISKGAGWKVIVLSGMDHPNVRLRRPVIRAAISHKVMDDAVRDECADRGPYPMVLPSAEHDDFVYALPPAEAAGGDDLPREDGHLGHRKGELRVHRPQGMFGPRRLGRYPRDQGTGLFDPVAWDQAVDRWRAGQSPSVPPDRVGLDAASEGDDDACAAPAWGLDADTLLSLHAEALIDRDHRRLEVMRDQERIRVGEIRVLPPGRGPDLAEAAHALWPRSWWAVEDIGDGKSTIDHARDVLGHKEVVPINVTGSPPPGHPLHDEQLCGNFRASMYVRAAMLVARGLVDPPDDPLLRQEILAMELRFDRLKVIDGEPRYVAYVIPKKWLKHRLGRSPDRADAFVLSLCRTEPLDEGEIMW